jgi:molybdopterin molybdotransferase
MLSVSDALALVLNHARPLPAEPTGLTPVALGRVLAEDVASDLDMPPFDKVLMDGYAVRTVDLPDGRGALEVIEEVAAGHTSTRPVAVGQATRIMTGAPVPPGADAVVMRERTSTEGGRVIIDDPRLAPGRNVLRRAAEMRCGEVVLAAGTLLRPQEIGLLATVGRTTAALIPPPRVAVLSTGDEVVEAPATPGPSQIRNSNGPMLLAQAARAGGVPHYLGLARDRLDALRPLVAAGLEADVLLLSGGVSAGKLDLTPGVLQEAGVAAHFHKVELKPGKPLLFGTRARGAGRPPTLVFGLPGNPVSALVCFELFVRPAMRRLRGLADVGPRWLDAVLAEDFDYATDRPTYHPARLEEADGVRRVRPVPWFGSADLRALTTADALVLFPPGEARRSARTRFAVLRLE